MEDRKSCEGKALCTLKLFLTVTLMEYHIMLDSKTNVLHVIRGSNCPVLTGTVPV